MQTTGHVIVAGEKVKVLLRHGRKIDKYCLEVLLKKRNSGKDGVLLEDESAYLSEHIDLFNVLKAGCSIAL